MVIIICSLLDKTSRVECSDRLVTSCMEEEEGRKKKKKGMCMRMNSQGSRWNPITEKASESRKRSTMKKSRRSTRCFSFRIPSPCSSSSNVRCTSSSTSSTSSTNPYNNNIRSNQTWHLTSLHLSGITTTIRAVEAASTPRTLVGQLLHRPRHLLVNHSRRRRHHRRRIQSSSHSNTKADNHHLLFRMAHRAYWR